MLRRYTFWLNAAVAFQFLTGAIHAISLFVTPAPENETERQLQELLTTYSKDMGGGFRPTFMDLFTALSACYSLLCFLGGLVCGYVRIKGDGLMARGLIGIHAFIFGVTFIVMLTFTFLPPIVLTGLIFVNLAAAFLLAPKSGLPTGETSNSIY